MDYKITIDQFEGPLDLLLHLIKKSDIDIYDISVVEITKQYLEYIEQMEELDLDIASEYLIMAAELIEIKSAMLLPNNKLEEECYEEDPRETLIKRLIEYKQYKLMTGKFKELEEERKQIFTKDVSDLKEYQVIEETMDLGEVDLSDLLAAFNKFLERKNLDQPLNTTITTKEYSVSERSHQIKNILKEKKRMDFEELFDVYQKDYIVVTFLSVLSLTKKQEINLHQENNFSKIVISLRGE